MTGGRKRIYPKISIEPGGRKRIYPKKFYRTWGSKTYIPKNFYAKTTYITLLSEKFAHPPPPPRPLLYFAPASVHLATVFQT
ncbi:hypothetical protein Hanom_Chr05g00391471 [Helianthus anomalus]